MSDARFPAIPPEMPRMRPSHVVAPICRWILKVSGWRMAGEFPNVPKLVAIAAPHSSNMDVVWGLLFKYGLRLNVKFIGKHEAFFWPLGPLLRHLGGIPIDRNSPHGVVGEMKREFQARARFWLAIAPEGTRKRVQKWKSGFWRIAREAEVPILMIYFHYPEKTIGLGELLYPTADPVADMARIRAFYAPWRGRNRGTI